MTPLGIGIVGLGYWGKKYLITLQMLNRDYSLTVFAADRNDLLLSDWDQPTVYMSYNEMLMRPEIKAIIVATPDETHYQIACQALKSSKDVLVEKPMALGVSEAEEMVHLAESTGRILATGHTAIYTEGFLSLCARLSALSPTLGKIVRVKAFRTSRGRKSGNCLWDLAPHDIAMAITLFGEPVDGECRLLTPSKAVYELVFSNGELFSGNVEWNSPPFRREFKIIGENGELSIDNTAPSREFRSSPLARQCEDFIFCCRTRRRPQSDGVMGLKVVRCLEMLTRKIPSPRGFRTVCSFQ
ncbi:MAG: Gfo/Idh/MocA family oxidoreductase [candidate division WOR-3 bacterium]